MKKLFLLLLIYIYILPSFAQENGRGAITKSIKEKDNFIGTKRALIIGISDYSSTNLTLKYADDDAELFKNYLTKIEKVKDDNITFLTNKNATSFNILNGLQSLIDTTSKNDIVYLFFAGHGDVVDKNNVEEALGFLLAYDVNENREFYGTQGVIPFKDINKTVNEVANKEAKIILVLDACRSGYLSTDGAQNNLKTFNKYLQNSTKLLSCNPNELSYEGDDLTISEGKVGQGYFTYYLVLGLMGAADNLIQDNKLQYFELQGFLDTNVNLATNNKQTPIIKTKTSTGVFKEVTSLDKKEALQQVQNPTGIKNILASRNISKTKEKGLKLNSDLAKKYNKALENKNYYGTPTSAFEIIKKALVKKQVDESLIKIMKQKLIASLSTSATLLINDYISELRLLPKGEEFLLQAKNLGICLKLMEKSDFSYDRIKTSKLFLEAYAIIRDKNFSNYPLAKKKLKKALEKEPKAAYIHNALGIVLHHEENDVEAEFHYKKANELIPSWSFPVNNMGTIFHHQYRYDEAINLYKRAIELSNFGATPYSNLGGISESKGQYHQAEKYYNKSLEINPNDLYALRNLADVNEKKGNIKKAHELYQKVIKIDSTYVFALYGISELQYQHGIDNNKPEYYLKKAIELEPHFSRGYAEYADYLRRTANYLNFEEADLLYDSAIKKDPFYEWSYAGRGWLQHKLKNKEKALFYFEKGIEINPGKAKSLYYLGKYYENGLDNRDKAEEYYKKAINLDEYYLPAYNAMISMYNENNQQDVSIELLDAVLKWNYEAPDLWNLVGNTHFSSNNYKDAIIAYRKALEIDPTYSKAYTNLSYSQLQQDLYEDATNNYKLAQNYNPYKYKLKAFSQLLLLKARNKKREGNIQDTKLLLELAQSLEYNEKTEYRLAEFYYLNGYSKEAQNIVERELEINDSKSRKIKLLKFAVKLEIDFKNLEKASIYLNELKTIDPIQNEILEALLLNLKGKDKEARLLLKSVNKYKLENKYLTKYNERTKQILNTLKQ